MSSASKQFTAHFPQSGAEMCAKFSDPAVTSDGGSLPTFLFFVFKSSFEQALELNQIPGPPSGYK